VQQIILHASPVARADHDGQPSGSWRRRRIRSLSCSVAACPSSSQGCCLHCNLPPRPCIRRRCRAIFVATAKRIRHPRSAHIDASAGAAFLTSADDGRSQTALHCSIVVHPPVRANGSTVRISYCTCPLAIGTHSRDLDRRHTTESFCQRSPSIGTGTGTGTGNSDRPLETLSRQRHVVI
jgi:hypothetical protein